MINKSYLRRTVRRITRRNPLDLRVYFTPTKKLFCFFPNGLKPEAIDLSVPTPDYTDPSGGYRHFLNLVTDRFHIKSIFFHIDDSSDFRVMGMMKEAVLRGLQLGGLLIRARELPFSVAYFLSKCTREATLQLYSPQSRSLLVHNFSTSPLQWIRVREGAGVRLSTLMSMMHCRRVEVSRVFIEGDKLNRVIRRWMRQPDYRLEEMELRFDLHRLDTNWKIMEGIEEAVRMDDNCYSIQRSDGVKATVFFTEQLFLMKVYGN
ncbi:hypothetical protein GCK72_003455 [Caenorhabditis remanei]|nr:hypothetical protein GCK72_003455 [Caenorhabditis remanei]KAF1771628.1 hypothetical protein GCK72_003455 [Caenorhabditis remanei]